MYNNFLAEQGKRHRWTIKVYVPKLLECCKERMTYHQSRVAFWRKQHETAEGKLRSDGIKLAHFEVTGGQRTEAQLDAALAKRVGECENRLRYNQAALDKFHAFDAMLQQADKADQWELNADDVLYFNLGNADRQTEEE